MFELRGPFGKRVVDIAGGRASVTGIDGYLRELTNVDRKNRTTSQLFNASRIAGKEHLVHAARLALIAHSTGRNFADSLNVELVCWAAAERQISRAFEKVGLCRGDKNLAILTLGATRMQVKRTMVDITRRLEIERKDDVLELVPQKVSEISEAFSISKDELKIAPIQKLVLERVALLALEK
ncbi:MAG: KEOPS complex subunit Cgi121 [Candidatus Hodarchaeaceae archaeon]|nr:KEOPS complex subunit Cgi121 [Candidatus Hodarchaeaceae archaeon]